MHPLILLHGALGSKEQLQPLAEALRNHYDIHLFNFSGHGGRPFAEEPFSIAGFSQEIMSYMEESGLQQASVFGYSMGGYAAMHFAKQFPGKAMHVITLATKFHWDETIAAREINMMNATTILEKVPAFAAQLDKRHAPNSWTEVLEKTKYMLSELGKKNTLLPDDYTSISTPCLLLLGDRDKMVTLDETTTVFKKLPQAQFGILPGTPHALEQVNVRVLATMIPEFISLQTP
jgi:pimeloyl-ACP methyl ester carboxylesterase